MLDIGRVGIIGGSGWLGSAIARALLNSGTIEPESLICSFRSKRPEGPAGCIWTEDNRKLVERSDVVIVSVRPGDFGAIDIRAEGKLVISVMAGVTVSEIKRKTGSVRVARAMPNAAAELGYSYTPIFLDSPDKQDRDIVDLLFRSCGEVDAVASEEQIEYFTALSGSGAAFPPLLAEAMIKDAISRGIAPELAQRAAQSVLIGAGRLQEFHAASPFETVKTFVDYAGTTAAGIKTMREKGFDAIVSAGLEAAFRKALELRTV